MIDECLQVGSLTYLRNLKKKHLTPHAQLDLIINQHFQAYIDHYGFLQLPKTKYQLAPTLHPGSYFYVYLRDLVIAAYPTTSGLAVDDLGRKVHLFRYYLDRQNVNYIRRYPTWQPQATDFQRLQQYAHDYCYQVDFQTDATFHNRVQGQLNYPSNMKVQLIRNSYRPRHNRARMIEFIFDIESGRLISQWNVLHFNGTQIDSNPAHYSVDELRQIANTESLNYGIPYGGRPVFGKYAHTHQYLDLRQPVDSQLRRQAKLLYPYPRQYVDLIKRPRDILAWRSIPKPLREPIYQEYLTAFQKHQIKSRGINYFLGSHYSKFHRYYVPIFRYNTTIR